MRRASVFFFLFILCLYNRSSGNAESTRVNKNILILFGQVPSSPAYKIILEGINNQLTDAYGDSYQLYTEYLEIENYPAGMYPKERFDLYNDKFKNQKLDLLICIGHDVIGTVKKYAATHLMNLPAISVDYDFSSYGIPSDISLNDHTAVIGLKINVDKILSTALTLFPGTNSIYFISGVSRTDKLFLAISRKAAEKISREKKIEFITDLPMEDVLNKVRQLRSGSIVVISSFYTDSRNIPYYNPEVVRLTRQASKVPVITYTEMGLGEGAVGGYLLNFNDAGKFLGKTAVDILKGADPRSVHITENDYSGYYFDWRELKRFDLAGSALIPSGSHLLFKEATFLDKYKWILGAVIFFLFLQTLLIVNLVLQHRKQKKIALQLREAENKFREMVREDRILIMSQLTASLSHELNQPLTAILSMAQAGNRFVDSGKMDPVLLKEIFQNIADEDKRTASILSSIREMMSLEKREKGKINLNSLVEELVTIYRGEAILMKNKLVVKLPEEPIFVVVDQIQIQQVLLNLLRNGSQAMDQMDPEKRVLAVTVLNGNETVTVIVRDHGKGIDPAVEKKLFKPFVTSRKEGLGIGLAISQNIIDKHDGKIWARNMPDGGAEFSFSLKKYADGH